MSGSGYKGLLMGCSRPYWMGIIKKINDTYGTKEWSWNALRAQYPEISNSDLRRLNCSNWFKKCGKDNKTSLWRLQPDAAKLCKIEIEPPKPKRTTMRPIRVVKK